MIYFLDVPACDGMGVANEESTSSVLQKKRGCGRVSVGRCEMISESSEDGGRSRDFL